MARLQRELVRIIVPLAALAWACVYPTERSGELRVVIDSIPELVRGEVYQLTASVVDAGGSPVPNAEVSFASQELLIAVVDGDGVMLAVGVGTTEITATSVEFAQAQAAVQLVRIHDLVEIDSIAPAVARFGDTIQIFGTGLNPSRLFAIVVGGVEAPVKSFRPFEPDEPERFGRLTVWVPPPALPISQAFVLGVDGLATSPDSVRIFQRDIYEPNDTIPWDFSALAGPVTNPALAFEHRGREDNLRFDWYRFTQAGTQDWTIIVRSDVVGPGSYQVFLTDSLFWGSAGFGIGARSWTIGPRLYACSGFPFAPPQRLADSVVVALRGLPVGSYDILAAYDLPGAYELSIVPEYRSALAPDASEENDFCDLAAPLTVGDSLALTIDNPHDIDWFRFTVAGAGQSFTFDISGAEDEADVDIYVLRDATPDSLPLKALSNIEGSSDEVTVPLDPGDYFVVVVDFAGVPTPYTLTAVSLPTPASEAARPPAQPALPGNSARAVLTFPKNRR